jgi:dolichol-phosphate mannosyltransferase
MTAKKFKLSIIVPVFNEEKTVERLLQKVIKLKLPQQFVKEIIVVDDFSNDNTNKILKRLDNKHIKFLKHKENLGKGGAVKTGFKNASGDYLIIQDADLEYDPEYINLLLFPILKNEFQVVYGTRLKNYPLILWGKNKTVMPSHWLGNKFLTCLTNLIYQANITDMETCYKLFPKEVINQIDLKSKKFDMEVELTAKTIKLGYQIGEVPIKVRPRTHKDGKKISWKDGFAAVWALVKFRFID